MTATVASSNTLDLAQTAKEARLLQVASRKKTTSNAYRSGAKNYKVSWQIVCARLQFPRQDAPEVQWPHAQEWCQRTPGADASEVTDAQTGSYARHPA